MCGAIPPLPLYHHDVVLNKVQGQLSSDSCQSVTLGAHYFVTFVSCMAFAVMHFRSLLFWEVALHRFVLCYQNFGAAFQSFSRTSTPEVGTNTLSGNAGVTILSWILSKRRIRIEHITHYSLMLISHWFVMALCFLQTAQNSIIEWISDIGYIMYNLFHLCNHIRPSS
jgi:hypothetical protein